MERWAGGRTMTERKSLGRSVDLKNSNGIDLGKRKIRETRDVLGGGNATRLRALQR